MWRDGSLFPPKPEGWPESEDWPFDREGGQIWIGDKGMILAGTYAENPRLLDPRVAADVAANPTPKKYPRTEGVYREWFSAIREGKKAGSDFAGYAGPMTEMILIGVLAVRMGRTLEMNPDTGAITNATPPSEWVNPTFRSGWSL